MNRETCEHYVPLECTCEKCDKNKEYNSKQATEEPSSTLLGRLEIYEGFLHDINLYMSCGRSDLLQKLLNNADAWSYAHRFGNGELDEKEQRKIIKAKLENLRIV